MTCGQISAKFYRAVCIRSLLSPSCQKRRHLLVHRHFCVVTADNKSKQWHFTDLKPYGKLVVRSASPLPVIFKLSPISPHDHPSQDQALIRISGDPLMEQARIQCQRENDVIIVSDTDEAQSKQHNTSTDSPIECDVQVPLKYDCDVQLQGHNGVSISQFENQDIDIAVQHGNCRMKNIKAANIQIRSESGSVVSESLLQGNAFIQSESGNINLHKPQSQTLTIQTQEGDIHVQNLYADKSSITGHHSNVSIGSCHRNVQVAISYQGNLKIDSIDGTLQTYIKSGNVDVLVSKHEWVNIKNVAGAVNIKIPGSVTTTLDAKGDSVQIDKSLVTRDVEEQALENGQRNIKGLIVGDSEDQMRPLADIGHINIDSGGSVQINCQDWLSSLNMNFKDLD